MKIRKSLDSVCKICIEENRGNRDHSRRGDIPFFIASGNTPKLLEMTDRSFKDIPLLVALFVRSSAKTFIAMTSNGTTDMFSKQVLSKNMAGIAFIGHQMLWMPTGLSRTAENGAAFHRFFRSNDVAFLTRHEPKGDRSPFTFTTNKGFGAEIFSKTPINFSSREIFALAA